MSNSKQKYFPIVYFLIFLLVVDYVATMAMKYSFNGMNLTDYDFFYVGNLLSTVILVFSLVGVAVKLLLTKEKTNLFYFLITIVLIEILIIIVVILLKDSDLIHTEEYFFGYPSEKLYIYILLLVRSFLQVYFLSLCWLSIFGHDKLHYVRGLFPTAIIGTVLFVFGFLYSQQEFPTNYERKESADAAMVLGAAVWKKDKPTPLFEARILKAHELYTENKVKKIIVTGSNAPGELTEAEAASRMLTDLGVKRYDVRIEKYSRNTREQMTYLRALGNGEKVIVISDKFHLTRATEIGQFLHLNFDAVASEYIVGSEKLLFYRVRETFALMLFWFYGV